MICEVPTATPPQVRRRAVIAGERAQIARASLADCRLCAHDCRVNRLAR